MTSGNRDPAAFSAVGPSSDEEARELRKSGRKATCPERDRDPVPVGASVYNRYSLVLYDLLVHFFSNRFVWRCPTVHLIEHARACLSPKHLEMGIGSGKLFQKVSVGRAFERLAIADVNLDCLGFARKVLHQENPETWKVNLLNPREEIQRLSGFQSIGLNYVLHCLPLEFREKLELCGRLMDRCLEDGGVLSGCTLFPNLNPSRFSRKLMGFYNRRGVFHNQSDDPKLFWEWIDARGLDPQFYTVGCVGFFSLKKK